MSNLEVDTILDSTLEMDLKLTPSEADVFRTFKSAQKKTLAENTLPPTMGWLGKFTAVRLLFSRLFRTLNTAYQFSKYFAFSFFQHACAIGGLSYLADVIICGKIMFQWMFAQENKDKYPGFWDRWNQMPNKTALVYNFWNGVVWFAVNFICFFLAPPVAIALNFAGFIFDIGNEIYKTYYDIKPQQELLKKIEAKLKFNTCSTDEKTQLKLMQAELINEIIPSTKRNRYWTIFTATCIVVGIAIFAFCPPAALAGALVMLIGGSVIGGFGRQLFKYISSKFSKSSTTQDELIPASETLLADKRMEVLASGELNDESVEMQYTPVPTDEYTQEEDSPLLTAEHISSGSTADIDQGLGVLKTIPLVDPSRQTTESSLSSTSSVSPISIYSGHCILFNQPNVGTPLARDPETSDSPQWVPDNQTVPPTTAPL